jgi:methanogenic corrinoid protein MtbC1
MATVDLHAFDGICESESAAYPAAEAGADGYERNDSARDSKVSSLAGYRAQLRGLVRTIEGEIIPRLVLSGRSARHAAGRHADDGAAPDADNVTELAMMLLRHDASVALAYVESIRDVGAPLGEIYLNLLAPAARRLGELWHQDRCSFVEVTLGLCSLHQVLRSLSPQFVGEAGAAGRGKRILLVPALGEQHTFGLMMVVEFFRRSGWDVRHQMADNVDDLARLVRNEWFSVVGLSVGCEARIESVAPAIRAVRRASCNRGLGVMVGGSIVNARPDLVPLMGADATAGDGLDAVRQAERVVNLLTVRT